MPTADPALPQRKRSSPPSGRVLVVEPDAGERALLAELVGGRGHAVETARTGAEALAALERGRFDAVLLALRLPDTSGLDVLSRTAGRCPAEFVVLAERTRVEGAVEAVRLGAFDYVRRPVDPDVLFATLGRALDEAERRRADGRQRHDLERAVRARMIGDSPALERVWETIRRVAPTRATVLLVGETGTGKEMAARAVHDLSPRAAGPFVPVQCSAIPETLLEAELFGHRKGAFTGAVADRRGLVAEAEGGTLFLDEVATLSHAVQVKLLRVLQERRVQRLGDAEPHPVDFRLVAATNERLERKVAEGRFREDLFYRLNVFPVHLPPLRERRGDIPELARRFAARTAEANGFPPPEIAPEAMRRLVERAWPGNVRELENVVERAVILGGGRTVDAIEPAPEEGDGDPSLVDRARREEWTLERLEREYVLRVIEETGGHRGRAAEILGIDRRTLYRKLALYGWSEDGDEAAAG